MSDAEWGEIRDADDAAAYLANLAQEMDKDIVTYLRAVNDQLQTDAYATMTARERRDLLRRITTEVTAFRDQALARSRDTILSKIGLSPAPQRAN